MEPQVIFENDSVLAINKPAGLVVNRANSVKQETVQDWAGEYLNVDRVENVEKVDSTSSTSTTSSTFQERSGIVHRIDKDTSGVLLIAKTPKAFEELQRQFKEREIEKTYLALVRGVFELGSGVIKAPVGRLPWNRERFGILAGGRESETRYKIVGKYELRIKNKDSHNSLFDIHNLFSLVEFYPKTGRTHQIRVHAKYVNHPLVADAFYAGRKTSRRDREWCPRLFLHAKEIIFTDPQTKKRIKVEAPLPEDLQKALSTLKKV